MTDLATPKVVRLPSTGLTPDQEAAQAGHRRMLRLEARNAEVPIERKPAWIRTTLKQGPEFQSLRNLVKSEGLHTVCQEDGCPNIFE